MGFIDTYVKKHVTKRLLPVRTSFANVSKDIQNIQHHIQHLHHHTGDWHSYLHNKSQKIEREIQYVKNNIEEKVSQNVKNKLDRIQDDVEDMRHTIAKKGSAHTSLEQDLKSLRTHLNHVFSEYNKHIVALHNKIKDAHVDEGVVLEFIENEVKKQLQHIHALQQKSEPKVVHTPPPVAKPAPRIEQPRHEPSHSSSTLRFTAGQLTPAQKMILSILSRTNQKLSYKDIAAAYGKSPSTVKTLLLSLRRHNIPIKEISDDTEKRFYLEDNFKKIILSKSL